MEAGCPTAPAVVAVSTAVPDPDADKLGACGEATAGEVVEIGVTTAPFTLMDDTLVEASFVAGPETYFVHNPPKTSLQSAGYAVPPLMENISSVVKEAILDVM